MMGRSTVFAAAIATSMIALAPAATAEPVPPYSVTVVGSTDAIDGHVQVTIDKPAGRQTCQAIGVAAGADITNESNYAFRGTYRTSTTDSSWSWGFAPVPDGIYDVHWGCSDSNNEHWGSFPVVPEERRQEPVRNVHVSHDPNATGGQGSIDFGSLTSGFAFGS